MAELTAPLKEAGRHAEEVPQAAETPGGPEFVAPHSGHLARPSVSWIRRGRPQAAAQKVEAAR